MQTIYAIRVSYYNENTMSVLEAEKGFKGVIYVAQCKPQLIKVVIRKDFDLYSIQYTVFRVSIKFAFICVGQP